MTELHAPRAAVRPAARWRTHADFLLGESRAAADRRACTPTGSGAGRATPICATTCDYLRDQLAAAGHDVIVVDQTSPEQRLVGLRTACVIVPGLIPIDFGWQRQRAPAHAPHSATAFRRAGWRGTDLDPADINRVPHPFP